MGDDLALHLAWFGADPVPAGPAPDPELERLGRTLYRDPRWSSDGRSSCAGCHDGGADDTATIEARTLRTPDGHDRTASDLVGVHLHTLWFWDGRADSLSAALREHLADPRVLGHASLDAAARAAGEASGEALASDRLVEALEAALRSRSTRTRFDRHLTGDAGALGPLERSGLDVFLETGCVQCHNHRTFGGAIHQKFATYEVLTDDRGVGAFVDKEFDHCFKVPSLLGVTRTPPYFHDGRTSDLAEAVRLMARTQNGKDLDDERLEALLAFLATLDPLRRD